jgi:hypothetical protein
LDVARDFIIEYKAATAENVGNDLRIGYGSLFV